MGSGKRLKYFVESQMIDKKKIFSTENGFNYSNMVNIMNEKIALGLKIVDKLKVQFPYLNINWLLYGEGEMILNENNEVNEPRTQYQKLENDMFENMLLEYLDRKSIKKKIHEIVQGK